MKLEDHLHQSAFPSEDIKLILHVQVLARQLLAVSRKVLAPFGLTPQQYNVLRILRGQHGTALAVQDLAVRMIDPSSNASRLVDKLVEKQWVTRRVCPADRRRAEVTITDSGRTLLKQLDTLLPPSMEAIVSALPSISARQLNAGLEEMLNRCDEALTQP